MRLLDSIYFGYYMFYKNVLKEEEPHTATILGLGASLTFLVLGMTEILFGCVSGVSNVWSLLWVAILILLFLFLRYLHPKSKYGHQVVWDFIESFRNKKLLYVCVLVFCILTTSVIFIGFGRLPVIFPDVLN